MNPNTHHPSLPIFLKFLLVIALQHLSIHVRQPMYPTSSTRSHSISICSHPVTGHDYYYRPLDCIPFSLLRVRQPLLVTAVTLADSITLHFHLSTTCHSRPISFLSTRLYSVFTCTCSRPVTRYHYCYRPLDLFVSTHSQTVTRD